ncbi:MAG: potassium-transporting ATPase subunit KdpC [Dongiaceae bacterium]
MQHLKSALLHFLGFTLLVGFIYPAAVWGIGQVFFASQAGGSLIRRDEQVIGSSLIAQPFQAARYFHGRPSNASLDAKTGILVSGASNLSPHNPSLIRQRQAYGDAWSQQNPNVPPPLEFLSASASGLDPHISLAGALAQAPRVAEARKAPIDEIQGKIISQLQKAPFRFLGQDYINVVGLNLALDAQ